MSEGRVEGAGEDRVTKVIRVNAAPAVAWRVFVAMGTWWPLPSHHIGRADAVDAVIEPRVGGRWYERGADGSTCDWGRVLTWEPHQRLVLAWQISAEWQHDPGLHTEVEVRFVPDGAGTRVELEHRGLGAYGARRDEMRAAFDSEGGWNGMLAAFAAATP